MGVNIRRGIYWIDALLDEETGICRTMDGYSCLKEHVSFDWHDRLPPHVQNFAFISTAPIIGPV